MKELSIEEKAKAYDEAIARMNRAFNSNRCTLGFMNEIFPEFKESEGERIKKAIKYGLDYVFTNNTTVYETTKEQCLAWLEKQDEQKLVEKYNITGIGSKNAQGKLGEMIKNLKPADKVEPKFKVGDWIVDNNIKTPFLITDISNDKYDVISIYGNDMAFSFREVEHFYHLWTIQDAKDGDVLASNNSIFIFQEEYIAEKPIAYCGIMNGCFIKGQGACWTNEKCYPATKEQRDTLIKAMTEAGYTFDFEKKELKKVEDKLTEEYNGEDYGIDGLYHAQRILEKTLGSVDGYQTDDGILSHKCAITAVSKLSEQKTTIIISNFRVGDNIKTTNEEPLTITKIDEKGYWSEDLFICDFGDAAKWELVEQKPAEWSEGDEKILQDLIDHFEYKKEFTEAEDFNILLWLKSLKDRYTWKPSEKQMITLRQVISGCSYDIEPLVEIEEQLKKLREE